MLVVFNIHFITLNVFITTFSISFVRGLDVDEVLEVETGSDVQICPLNYSLPFSESKGPREGNNFLKNKNTKTVNKNGVILIQNVTYMNAGLYTCATEVCSPVTEKSLKRYTYNDTTEFAFISSRDESLECVKKIHRTYLNVKGKNKFMLDSIMVRDIYGKEHDKTSITVLVLLLVLIFIFAIFTSQKERKLRKRLKHLNLDDFEKGLVKNINPELNLCNQANLLPYDKKWEIQLDDLKLGQQLGSGAFGVVVKGELRNFNDKDCTTVAVKKVNKSSSFECLKALASELKIMIHLGQHVNIVNLVGACTKNIGKRELYVVVEYCRFGNIQHYLLKYKENFINQINRETGKYDNSLQRVISREKNVSLTDPRPKSINVRYVPSPTSDRKIKEEENSDSNESENIQSHSVNKSSNYENDISIISTKDLIVWSFQVAKGMEYLASRKVLHGDLAARNILLADENVVKICDFGLAKQMDYKDIYKKSNSGPLPIKWMAIESIVHKIFSTQSDIWSFGVVLWEFFSLGMTPYPTMQVDETFLDKISKGYRMESPEFAPREMYRLMLECWQKDPLMRPSFTELAERIGSMLEDPVKNYYLEMNDYYVKMNNQFRGDDYEDYLSMMKSPDFENISLPRHSYINTLFTKEDVSSDGYLNMEVEGFTSQENNQGEEEKDVKNSEDVTVSTTISNPKYFEFDETSNC